MAAGQSGRAGVIVRPLASLEEFAGAVHLQRSIWGWDELDLLPVRFFVVAGRIGGQTLGAFDKGYMCGFLLAIPGVKPGGRAYLHSHMTGVLPEFRNTGAGLALKLAQRDDAIARGINLVEWSFDPMEAKNAFFNLAKLGAVVRTYVPNMYGVTSSSLQGGMPTDRCIAEWHLGATPVPGGQVKAILDIPSDFGRIRRSNPEVAREIQQQTAQRFQELLAEGLAASGFERRGDTGAYLFRKI